MKNLLNEATHVRGPLVNCPIRRGELRDADRGASRKVRTVETALLAAFAVCLGASVPTLHAQNPREICDRLLLEESLHWQPCGVQSDGKVLVTRNAAVGRVPLRLALARLNSDGTYDDKFGPDDGTFVRNEGDLDHPPLVAVQADSGILVGIFGGHLELPNGQMPVLVRLDRNGTLEAGFRYEGMLSSVAPPIPLPDGRFYCGAARFLANGSTDSTFRTPFDDRGFRVEGVQTDGRVLIVLEAQIDQIVLRLLPDGTRDPEFGEIERMRNGGRPGGVRVLPDGRILVFGFDWVDYHAVNGLLGLGADRAFTTPFEPFARDAPRVEVDDVRVDLDGKIVVAGRFPRSDGTLEGRVMRLNLDGSPDPEFSLKPAPACGPTEAAKFATFPWTMIHPDGSYWVNVNYYTSTNRETILCSESYRLIGTSHVSPFLRLSGPQLRQDGGIGLTCAASIAQSRTLVLEASSTLTPVLWQPVATNATLGSTMNFVDRPAATSASRFYRVRELR